MNNKTLATDFYELTMGQVYFNEGMKDTQVVFDIFFRKNPFNGGYTISGGLEETINYVNNFRFGKAEIDYLRSLNTFSEEYLDYLANLKFKGDIYAVQDGTAVFPNEPVLKVKADIITAQLLETSLLTNFNHGALVVTKAKRITSEANGKPVANVDLWLTLIPYFDHFWYNFKKVPGHANNFWNILCDELARNEAEKLKHNWRGIASEPTF